MQSPEAWQKSQSLKRCGYLNLQLHAKFSSKVLLQMIQFSLQFPFKVLNLHDLFCFAAIMLTID